MRSKRFNNAVKQGDNWTYGTSLTEVDNNHLGVRLGREPVVEPRFPDSCGNTGEQ
jgi:hypothetical protein